MVEIAPFSDNDFNVISWINSTFANMDSNQNKEANVSNVVSKLQLYLQQVNSALEDTCEQVLTVMPRIMKDIQILQNDASFMRTKMSEVQTNIAEVQKKTGSCMEKIEFLDDLKTKLQASKQGLQESDGWGRLLFELEDCLDQKDITKACTKLSLLQKSHTAQLGLPGQNERHTQIEGFKNRIEALVSPEVVECFTVEDAEKSKKYVEIYLTLERFLNITYYYRTVSKDFLRKQWIESVDATTNSGSPRFLREFYDFLLEYWKKQYKWCSNVFGIDGIHEPTATLTQILPALEPSREQIVKCCLKRSDDKLGILQEISSANVYFGGMMQKQIELIVVKPSNDQMKLLANAIYGYFGDFIPVYASCEQNNFLKELPNLVKIDQVASETVRGFGTANSKLFKWIEDALNRCNSITGNMGLTELISVFVNILKTYLSEYKKAQQQLYVSRNTAQNWSLLQSCVVLLQHIGNFRLQLEKFENSIGEELITKETELKNVENQFMYNFTNEKNQGEFQKLVDQIKLRKTVQYTTNNDEKYPYKETDSIFVTVFDEIKPICEHIHDTMFGAAFQPIQQHITSVVSSLSSSNTNGSNLPDYSFAPQELITQVGQYLLTLPQHLEPLLLAPSHQLKVALNECDIKYAHNTPSADVLLSIIVDECCALYGEQIGQIPHLNSAAAKQLATDIEYLGSVLEELGLTLCSRLQQTATLLRAPAENYLSVSSGFDPVVVTSIRQIRNIVSS